MKYSLSLVALAAGLSQVTATGFHDAPKFSCPDNTDNVCIPDIVGGIDWSGLPFGGFDSYKGFKWSGFSCSEKFGKRDLTTRTNFQSKCATGTATSDKGSSPKISCDKSKGVSKTSIKTFQITPEFDCDLEFHYTMPDGSTCKHRSPCKASGTTVENTQCGGATDVTVVYPQQPKLPKKTCGFGIHHIDFDCSGPKPTKSASSSYIASSPTYVASTPSKSATASSYSASTPSTSSTSYVVATSSSTSSYVVSTSSTSSIADTTTYPATLPTLSTSYSASIPAGNSSSYVLSTTLTAATTSSSSASVTSYLTTSTVYATSVQTITSCAATVTNCPAHSTVLTTVTVPVSTTVCPVTETVGVTTPASSTTVASSATGPAGPVETLPCPGVVPSCLNTWIFSVGCKDNTDSACYCPDAAFVKNIFTCLYAHGESDSTVSEAIGYFQGICAPFVPTNPGIATGAETITTILTATPTAYPSAVTTIEVATTVVVPCTNEAGETIPSSSSTVVVSTSLTVPGVVFTTLTSGPSSTGVAVVPGTYSAVTPVATAPSTPGGAAPLYPTTAVSTTLFSVPAGTAPGTGAVYPTATPSTPVVAGAAHIGAGMGLLGFAGMLIAAAL
ncbi:hypothetical protein GGR54DRAFT_123313 [Hypoxylon sp. NC1633]|nr:hypothetical protein GGR54DRAFT_123313 [Hypoxylon sp. NC1633]